MAYQESGNVKLSSHLKEMVIESVVEAMEPWGFMEVVPSEDFVPYNQAIDRIRVEILVIEPFQGGVRLVLPRELAVTITHNLYSYDLKDINEGILKDLMSEVLNVIAGRLMGKIVPPSKPFKIGLPEIGKEAFLTSLHSAEFSFDMEGQPFWLMLIGDGFFVK